MNWEWWYNVPVAAIIVGIVLGFRSGRRAKR